MKVEFWDIIWWCQDSSLVNNWEEQFTCFSWRTLRKRVTWECNETKTKLGQDVKFLNSFSFCLKKKNTSRVLEVLKKIAHSWKSYQSFCLVTLSASLEIVIFFPHSHPMFLRITIYWCVFETTPENDNPTPQSSNMVHMSHYHK